MSRRHTLRGQILNSDPRAGSDINSPFKVATGSVCALRAGFAVDKALPATRPLCCVFLAADIEVRPPWSRPSLSSLPVAKVGLVHVRLNPHATSKVATFVFGTLAFVSTRHVYSHDASTM